MSDKTDQTVKNLTFELLQLATDHLKLCTRLNDLNPDIVSNASVHEAQKRLRRLRTLSEQLSRQGKSE